MSNNEPIFHYVDESQTEKLARKSKDSPFMIVGLMGLIAACGIGAYKYKQRGGMSTSVFLMQLRVLAQGTVVGALTIGIICTMVKENLLKNKDK